MQAINRIRLEIHKWETVVLMPLEDGMKHALTINRPCGIDLEFPSPIRTTGHLTWQLCEEGKPIYTMSIQ